MKLEDYGFIGDTHTGALVGLNGSIDWFCAPRFDSGACFAALLGEQKNGCWRIGPSDETRRVTHSYRGETLVLETIFETASGSVRLIDCMPMPCVSRTIIRVVEGISGRVNMEMKLIARFDYGVTVPWVMRTDHSLTGGAGPNALILRADVPTFGEDMSTVARFSVGEGERKSFVLSWYPSHETPPEPIDAWKAIEETEKHWREWCARCTCKGEYRDIVVRSLLTLKALTYAPTGGIVAALTTSLPERIGGVRNWDYRFCWLRDATFTLYSFMLAGYKEEAEAWSAWLLRAVAGDPAQLQIVYGPAGERHLTEEVLAHLAGYENSVPVRIGNAASEQVQLDVYGEVLDAMYLARKLKIKSDPEYWHLERRLVDHVAEIWRKPDDGIWEIRGARRQFTHSKVMAWVAVDRAIRSVEDFGLEGPVDEWRTLREEIHREACEKGYNSDIGSFTQYYGTDKLDASLLMIPLVGFLPVTDRRVRGTIEAIERDLMADGFVLRYHPDKSSSVDGLPPGEAAFLPCTCWLIDCLHLLGREKDARAMFRRLLDVRSGLGLFSEEYDTARKRLVGNIPQAFTHVGVVNTALNLSPQTGPADHRGATAHASI
jgi:GH15 family glucan-1,4-alpha-glucosidase